MAIQGKYINLFTDFGFKRVFGEEANKDILMDFLNQVLPKDYTIDNLHFSKNEHVGLGVENRKAVFDIYCISEKGERFIVELQKARQDYFKDRSVYYASFPIQEMAKKGKSEEGEWDYQLDPVFTVGILNFAFKDSAADANKLYHHVQLKDQDCQVFYEKLHFIYLELSKFAKPLSDCKSRYEKWLWIFKNLPTIADIPLELQQATFIKLFNISEVAKFNKKEQAAYQASLKHFWDLNNVVDTAFKEGEVVGFEKGEISGFEKGETAGIQLILTIIRLHQEAHSIASIAKMVKQTIPFVEKVLKDAGFIKL
ncbi:MAG: Rpn family recombination-promoting nuclease/putative transposase [Saprospiraceae bacterium]